MDKAITILKNYILTGTIGAACGLLLVVREIQLFLMIHHSNQFSFFTAPMWQTAANGLLILFCLWYVFRNTEYLVDNTYALNLIMLIMLTFFIMFILSQFKLSAISIYALLIFGELQSTAIMYVVLIDHNFIERGHKAWL